jgi:DNA-binding LytR/AlgR family response regulator
MSLSCLIIDDEYLAVQVIEEYAKQYGQLIVRATFTKPKEALEFLKSHSVDLLFLDIQMPQVDGFDLLAQVQQRPMVIFTTARENYAVKAFELEVLDYLVKPVPYDRFEKAVKRAEEYSRYKNKQGKTSDFAADYLMVKADYRIHKIQFEQIEYIEGLSEYIKIHTTEKTHITLAALKDIIEQLPSYQFIRVHKSYIVAFAKIKSYNHSHVMLREGKELPVGRVYREGFIEIMKKGSP